MTHPMRYAAYVAVLSLGVASSAQADQLATSRAGMIAAAKKEGALDVVWSTSLMGGASAIQQYQAGFDKMFGLKLAITFAPGAEVARVGNQLLAEMQAKQPASTDIYIGAAAQTQPLIAKNLFMPVPWPTLEPKRISAADSEKDGRALRIQTALSGVSYNTTLMPHPPKTLLGYLAPKWKGKLATTPYAAGFDILAANDFWGPTKSLDFVRKLSKQAAGLIRCGDIESLADGEYAALVMDCISNATLQWKARGAPVAYSIPSDGAQKRFYYVSVPRNSAHPNAAVLFGLYLLSRSGQATMWRVAHTDLDSEPGSHMAKLVSRYEKRNVRFPEVTIDWWAKHPEINKTKDEMIKILSRK